MAFFLLSLPCCFLAAYDSHSSVCWWLAQLHALVFLRCSLPCCFLAAYDSHGSVCWWLAQLCVAPRSGFPAALAVFVLSVSTLRCSELLIRRWLWLPIATAVAMVSSSFIVLVSSSEIFAPHNCCNGWLLPLWDIPSGYSCLLMHAMLADEIFNFLYMYSNLF